MYTDVCATVYESVCVCMVPKHVIMYLQCEPLDDNNVSVPDRGSFSNNRPQVCL